MYAYLLCYTVADAFGVHRKWKIKNTEIRLNFKSKSKIKNENIK